MTLGVTGVFWLSRPAIVNSTTLAAGAGSVPLIFASGAWTKFAAAYEDAALSATRVMQEVLPAWQGDAASTAQERLGAFVGWTHSTFALSAESEVKASAQATAYTVALTAMPSVIEIEAAEAARLAALASGGATNGSLAAAEAVCKALDIRAAMVMEAYEAATSAALAVRPVVAGPPPITAPSWGGASSTVVNTHRYRESDYDVETSPSRTSPTQAAVQSLLSNPNTQAQLAQAQSAATQVTQTGTSVASNAASSLGSAMSPMTHGGMGSGSGTHSAGSTGTGGSTGEPARTSAVSLGSGGAFGGAAALARSKFGANGPVVTEAPESSGAARAGGDGAASAARAGGAPVSLRKNKSEDDTEVENKYVDRYTDITEGVAVVSPVIGSAPEWSR